jgi:hypothetical protein
MGAAWLGYAMIAVHDALDALRVLTRKPHVAVCELAYRGKPHLGHGIGLAARSYW